MKLTPEQDQTVQKAVESFEPKKRKAVMEHMSIWKREGYEKGIQQGAAETALRQLSFRIGSIGKKTQSQIKKLPPPKLEALTVALLDFSKRSDLTNWLKNNS